MTHDHGIDRRSFIAAAGVAGLSLSATANAATTAKTAARAGSPVPMKKALKIGMINVEGSLLDKFTAIKTAGFDGVEIDSPSDHDPADVVAAAAETGIEIPGVVDSVHWSKPFSHPDAAVRAEGMHGLLTAIRDCSAVGGTTVLLVPAVVNGGISYADAYERSQNEIRSVLPICRELGIKIAIENVWNNFLLSPMEAARYTDEIDPEWVGWHFDIGNIVYYGWPAHWITTLGHRVWKLDVKDYSRQKLNDEGRWKGFGVKIGDGDSDWPACVDALIEIGYAGGWAAAEVGGGGPERLKEIADRMDEHLVGPFNARI